MQEEEEEEEEDSNVREVNSASVFNAEAYLLYYERIY